MARRWTPGSSGAAFNALLAVSSIAIVLPGVYTALSVLGYAPGA